MPHAVKLSRGARWAVPAGAVVAVAAVVAGTSLAGAQASAPTLPARTPAQLLADVQQAPALSPMTGTVQETASLGLPDLPTGDNAGGGGPGGASGGGASSALSLLSGTHTFNFWYADPQHVRIAEPAELGESDLRRDGQQVWLWDSKNQTATHVLLPQRTAVRSGNSGPGDSGMGATGTPPTPQQVARQILAAVGPTTTVSVQRNVTIAGQSAYQLAVAPKDSRSLIGQVTIAIDARRSLPLRVQVFARGSSSPAFQEGFTSLSFGAPAASNFAFTPPPGAKVKTVRVPAHPLHPTAARTGSQRTAGPSGSLYSSPAGWYAYSPMTGDTYQPGGILGSQLRPTVMGKGWLSVLVLSPGMSAGRPSTAIAQSSGSQAYSSTLIISPSGSRTRVLSSRAGHGGSIQGGDVPAIARALLRAATPVHGAWGSGRLLRTSLFSVLLTSKGTVLAGAVTPAVLYADAAAVK